MFDSERFKNTTFCDRTGTVELKGLAEFFGEGEKAEFVVRGLTAVELGRANEASARERDVAAVVEAIASPDKQEKVEAIRELLGVSDEVPTDTAKRHELLVLGSVSPEIDHELAVLLAERYPIEFYQLTNKISQLTGLGRVPGKQNGSGSTTQ